MSGRLESPSCLTGGVAGSCSGPFQLAGFSLRKRGHVPSCKVEARLREAAADPQEIWTLPSARKWLHVAPPCGAVWEEVQALWATRHCWCAQSGNPFLPALLLLGGSQCPSRLLFIPEPRRFTTAAVEAGWRGSVVKCRPMNQEVTV